MNKDYIIKYRIIDLRLMYTPFQRTTYISPWSFIFSVVKNMIGTAVTNLVTAVQITWKDGEDGEIVKKDRRK